ncbi:hypothetical protein AKJ51_01840 [candidate division MSBL1 archaeon SCGC-AAA382A20]|uniref:Uncharacterized protein n=1 Tax=candidate division MSBL1 archaeon SCGC-AAA382A20 TaxID=1698280 RepID=A0A133VL70_9EURY|nr:hypothetical protein AKJ51_01840 [candidate division MSBL1 archaeon SCGC-AAA382A20]
MREKRFKKKALSGLGIALVLAIGVGLLTVFATSSAAANVSVDEQEGISIDTTGSSVSLGPSYGFGRAYQSVGGDIFKVDPDPTDKDESVDFRITITQHSSLNDVMLKLEIGTSDDFTTANVYEEEADSAIDLINGTHTFYVNPGSGSTTLYVELEDDDTNTNDDTIDIKLVSASWAKNPFDIGRSGGSIDIVASGKALE